MFRKIITLCTTLCTILAIAVTATFSAFADTQLEKTVGYFQNLYADGVESGDEWGLIGLAGGGDLSAEIYSKYSPKTDTLENVVKAALIDALYGKDISDYAKTIHDWDKSSLPECSTSTIAYGLNILNGYYEDDSALQAYFADLQTRYAGNGGFVYMASYLEFGAEVDSSAQAFQGAYKYAAKTNSAFLTELNKVPDYIKSNMNEATGAVSAWGSDNPSSTAQALIAMTLTDDTATIDSLYNGLLTFSSDSGAFIDMDYTTMQQGESYIASYNALQALQAYDSYQNGKYIFDITKKSNDSTKDSEIKIQTVIIISAVFVLSAAVIIYFIKRKTGKQK
jgi:hypothetical protein